MTAILWAHFVVSIVGDLVSVHWYVVQVPLTSETNFKFLQVLVEVTSCDRELN